MIIYKAEHHISARTQLGECPIWDPYNKRLYWVDIEAGIISFIGLDTDKIYKYMIGTSIGAIGFCKTGNLICASGKGIGFYQIEKQSLEIINNPLPPDSNVRFNDGKVDPYGRFWCGGKDLSGNTFLYRLNSDLKLHKILKSIKISNGLDWDIENNTFYYTDSGENTIFRFDFEPKSGHIFNKRIFARFPNDYSQGTPDGLTLDSEGNIWVAIWGGSKVIQYAKSGNILTEIHLPVSLVTSVTFGGENLDELLITTASEGLSKQQRIDQPYAGDIFRVKLPVSGNPTSYFR